MAFMARKESPEDKEARKGVKATGEAHEAVLEARMVGRGVMRAPEAKRKVRTMARGGASEYRTTDKGDYDWFYSLAPGEQKRLRANWFAPKGQGEAPDAIDERMPLKEWLDHTRGADAARAVGQGKTIRGENYGGITRRRLFNDQREHPPAEDGTRFYTDSDGVVHPIPPKSKFAALYGGRHDYGKDEAF